MAATNSRSLKRAAARAVASNGDAASAARIAELENVRDGSYSLIRALVARLGGSTDQPIEIPRAEWKAPPPSERLRLEIDPDTNDAVLWIEPRT